MKLKEIIDHKIFTSSLSDIHPEGKYIINTINPHSYCEAKKDKIFTKALLDSDILLPDGFGIVLAAKILNGEKIKKIAGADIHRYLLEKAYLKGHRVFYLGSSENTLQLIKERTNKELSSIKMASYSPPFKKEFSCEDTDNMLEVINIFKPDVLFVGMTAPKQEKWVYNNKNRIDANVIVSIGAVFDFYAGTIKRPGKFWISLGLEWLPRLLNEPKRLWRRNFISTPLFLIDVLKAKYQ